MTLIHPQGMDVVLCKTASPTRWQVVIDGQHVGELEQTAAAFPRQGPSLLSFTLTTRDQTHQLQESTLRRAREGIADILHPSQPAPAAGPLLAALERSLR